MILNTIIAYRYYTPVFWFSLPEVRVKVRVRVRFLLHRVRIRVRVDSLYSESN